MPRHYPRRIANRDNSIPISHRAIVPPHATHIYHLVLIKTASQITMKENFFIFNMSRSKSLSSLLLTGNVVIFILSIHCCHAWISAPQSPTRPLSNLQKSTTDLNSSIPKFKRSRVLVHESPDGESTRASTITTPTSTEETIPSSKKSADHNKMNYNWQKQWYSVTFSSYVPLPTSNTVPPFSSYSSSLEPCCVGYSGAAIREGSGRGVPNECGGEW